MLLQTRKTFCPLWNTKGKIREFYWQFYGDWSFQSSRMMQKLLKYKSDAYAIFQAFWSHAIVLCEEQSNI